MLSGWKLTPAEPVVSVLIRYELAFGGHWKHEDKAEAFDRLMHLAKIGAWTEAALALIALELPLWRVRRLVYEDGEWLCSLSHQPNLPIALDDCVEATDEALPIAMLRAFVEACRRRPAMQESVSTVPRIQPWPEQIICCENYR